MFVQLVPDLKKSHLEYVIKITPKQRDDVSDTTGETAGGPTGAAGTNKDKTTKPPIVLVRFTDKAVRNQVFYEARKSKDKFKPKLVVRDDMTKEDHNAWSLAKPQMQVAHEAGGRSKCKFGRLTIDSKSIPIEGLLSTDRKIHEMNEKTKIPHDRIQINMD